MYSDEYRSQLSIVGGSYTETYNTAATPVTILPSSTISTTASTASTPSSTIPPAELSTPASPKSGLSPGAKAGVGVGVAVAAIAVVALVSYLYFFKRRRKHGTTAVAPGEAEGPGTKSSHEIDEKGLTIPYPKAELEGTPGPSRVEFDDRPELYGSTKVARVSSRSAGNTQPIYDAQARVIEESDNGHSQTEKEVTFAERHVPLLPQVVNDSYKGPDQISRTGIHPPQLHNEEMSPKYLAGIKGAVRVASHESALAQEDSSYGQGGQTLQRLKAEHAALLERIKDAEERERARGQD
jgi:hypothetical protein